MTAPTPRSSTPTVTSSGTTVTTPTLPLSPHQIGDYLLIFLAVKNVTTVTAPGTWGTIKSGNSGGVFLGLYQQSTLAASNAETAPQFTFNTGCTYTAHAYSIPMPNSGAINRAGVNNAVGTSATADPPSNTSFGGTQDNLWFAAAAVNINTAINSGPSGYPNFTASPGANGSSVGLGTAWKQALASVTEDPGTFGLGASVNWNAGTLAIWDPVTGGGSIRVPTNMLLGV